uniref:Phospholipase putative n=1 Tax=Albugo laibachii Nc14 TaxID=890382 RepID=F0WGH3_9STRA|nr:phospholipase putative [Albugo laibachii Nc14]|eukprot:CCA20336.1 phospholipase putative [Albugo laibachii Nc14]
MTALASNPMLSVHCNDAACHVKSSELTSEIVFSTKYAIEFQATMMKIINLLEHSLEMFSSEISDSTSTIAVPSDVLSSSLIKLKNSGNLLNEVVAQLQQQVDVGTQHLECSNIDGGTNEDHFDDYNATSLDDVKAADRLEFQDVVPVRGKQAAKALNDQVTRRILFVMNDDAEFERFKNHALRFGSGNEEAYRFHSYLSNVLPIKELGPIILDFARLLPNDEQRLPLLETHFSFLTRQQVTNQDDSRSYTRRCSTAHLSRESRSKSVVSDSGSEESDSEDDKINEFPSTLRLTTINHLMFIIHGIGQHVDFQEGEFKSWNGQSGLDGGSHTFRELFQATLDSTFREIPLALEMQSIEWHEDLHGPTGVDNVFDLICPEGSSSIREFNKDTLMDVLYYLSPRYGQLIINSVTKQLNEKYQIFLDEHPGWEGHVSIFAHSLGSVIAYDILSHQSGNDSKKELNFPPLNFMVDNFFAAGSPVPVMILSRGDLNIEERHFTAGINMPRCNRYFNIFHPIDPIAYRVEPLIKKEMDKKAPVQLLNAAAVRRSGFVKLQEMWELITAPAHGFPFPRIDFVMRRRVRENLMMEYAFATASHSSYWFSEDVVMFTIMQMCRPVIDKLRRYLSAQRPLPALSRNQIEFTPHANVYLSGTALIRDQCTGFSYERVVMMNHDRLFLIPHLSNVVCRRRWRHQFTSADKAVNGDDPFTLKIILGGQISEPSTSPTSQIEASLCTSIDTPQSLTLRASSSTARDEWIAAINGVTGTHKDSTADHRTRKHESLITLPSDKCVDYFGAMKVGSLQEKAPKGWYEGWTTRWIVLQENAITAYDEAPKVTTNSQYDLRKTRMFSYETGHLFRILSRNGTLLEMRVRGQAAFNRWLDAFAQVHSCVIFRHKDHLERSLSAQLSMTDDADHNGSEFGDASRIQTRIDGYQLALDVSGMQYAVFVIQVAVSTSAIKVVHRRHSEFKKLHQSLRKLLPNGQLPPLPDSRVWNKLEPNYLKDKVVRLHGYLNQICRNCLNHQTQPIILSFLELVVDPDQIDPLGDVHISNSPKLKVESVA